MAYKDVPTSTDLVRDGMKVLTVVAATCNLTDSGAAVWSVETGGEYRIPLAGIGLVFTPIGQQFIARTTVNAGGTANNDGIFTVKAIAGDDSYIDVVEPVVACTSVAATFDEIDTFILHPTKRIEQICVFVINSAATSPQISFVPGAFWAASTKKGIPAIQGQPLLATSNLFQVETAKYLQTKSEILTGVINRKGTILMRVIPATGVSGATVSVGLIQLY